MPEKKKFFCLFVRYELLLSASNSFTFPQDFADFLPATPTYPFGLFAISKIVKNERFSSSGRRGLLSSDQNRKYTPLFILFLLSFRLILKLLCFISQLLALLCSVPSTLQFTTEVFYLLACCSSNLFNSTAQFFIHLSLVFY